MFLYSNNYNYCHGSYKLGYNSIVQACVIAIEIFYTSFPWKYFDDAGTGDFLCVRNMYIFFSFYSIESDRENSQIKANKNDILMSVSGLFPHSPGTSSA
jgi:hypothetical protein